MLTWSPNASCAGVDEQLVVRLLAAARQGFDLLVVDTGRALHPQHAVIEQFTDHEVLTCDDSSKPPNTSHIVCGARNLRNSIPASSAYLGHFLSLPKITRVLQRGALFDVLRSRKVRQNIADLRLLPQKEATET